MNAWNDNADVPDDAGLAGWDAGTSAAGSRRAPEPPEARPPETWTVGEMAARIKSLVKEGFPQPVWVAGETSGLQRAAGGRGRHWYFTLVDEVEQAGGARASLSVTVWQRQVKHLFGPGGRFGESLKPADGLVLRLLVQPEFYAPHGRLNLIVEDVDPDYTLGQLDRERREVLARLKAEGALLRNAALPLTEVPLQIGLVTSDGSAAHHDVLDTLRSSGLGFRIAFCDARMQGAETTRSVRAALATLARRRPDVILLVRGGGSRLDLSWFDKEELARAVADCPVPVLTGIGHEIDRSVADEAAHAAFKTPTAVAAHVVERVREASRAYEQLFGAVVRAASRQLELCAAEVAHGREALCRRADQRLAHEAAGVMGVHRRVRTASLSRLTAVDEGMGELGRRLRAGAARALADRSRAVQDARRRLATGPHVRRPARQLEVLREHSARLARLAQRGLAGHEAGLEAVGQRVRLLDPVRVLERGYAIVRRPDGVFVKDAGSVRPGERLAVTLRDGSLDVCVERLEDKAVNEEGA